MKARIVSRSRSPCRGSRPPLRDEVASIARKICGAIFALVRMPPRTKSRARNESSAAKVIIAAMEISVRRSSVSSLRLVSTRSYTSSM